MTRIQPTLLRYTCACCVSTLLTGLQFTRLSAAATGFRISYAPIRRGLQTCDASGWATRRSAGSNPGYEPPQSLLNFLHGLFTPVQMLLARGCLGRSRTPLVVSDQVAVMVGDIAEKPLSFHLLSVADIERHCTG
ncbi:hypothetical protein BDP67DRAFT_489388 [Colletotrichum lupini]|nr:hypothetical protein BDP67DRAFT_489388 [Colletotrichum lupini]